MFDLMPFNKDTSLENYLNNLERELWGNSNRNFSGFKTDIIEESDKYILRADLPGVNKEDITIDISDNFLTISSNQKEESQNQEKNYIRKERYYGSYSRSFDISNVKEEEIKAKYDNGVLEVVLPKKQEERREIKKINIE